MPARKQRPRATRPVSAPPSRQEGAGADREEQPAAPRPDHATSAPTTPAEDATPAPSPPQRAEPVAPERDLAGQQAEAEPPPGTPSAWDRLRSAGAPRLTRANLLGAGLALLLGFAAVTQVRQNQDSDLETLRQSDLVALLGNANSQSQRLQQESQDLTRTRDQLRGSQGSEAAQRAARERLDTLGILAGTVAATGPGIELRIDDPDRKVTAPNLLDAVQELRDAGAEAIQIGDVRVVASSWVGTDGQNQLVVDGRKVEQPYRVLAIGDAHTMATAMAIPGGVSQTLRQAGATPKVTERKTLTVSALRRTSGGG